MVMMEIIIMKSMMSMMILLGKDLVDTDDCRKRRNSQTPFLIPILK